MRTVRCSGRLLGGGGCLPRGVSAQGVTARGCLPDTPLPLRWTESQTGVKTLHCRNYAGDGNNVPCTFGIPEKYTNGSVTHQVKIQL